MKSTGLKLTFAAAALIATAGPALADDAAPAWGTISGYVAAESDYRYRGISQNSKEFTPEGSLNWTGPEGFYAGTWLAKVNWGGNNPSFEMDIYGGKHFDLDGTDLNIEAYYYSYPDYNPHGGPKASYFEAQGYLSHTFDKLTVTVMGAYSPEWSLGGNDGWYTSGTLSYAITDWLSASGTVGHQWVSLAPSDYTHYDIGLTATYKSFSVDVRYVGSDIGKTNCGYWMATPNACGDTVKANITFNVADLFK
jgi:uncharacterized protein (TIGR02001 family)